MLTLLLLSLLLFDKFEFKRGISSAWQRFNANKLKLIEKGTSETETERRLHIPKICYLSELRTNQKIYNAVGDENNSKDYLQVASDGCRRCVPLFTVVQKEKTLFFAKELYTENFLASGRWVNQWKIRFHITVSTCTSEMTAPWTDTTLPTILSNYKLEQIYNANEFGLFYQADSRKSLRFKSETCEGKKHNKIRLTGLAVANALKINLLMFVIGSRKCHDISMD